VGTRQFFVLVERVPRMEKMEIKIDRGILHCTTKCTFNFGCITGEKTCLCDVVVSNEEDIVEIKSKPSMACKYCISLTSAHYCHCPTRVEIYNRYKI
jgi:hypothetical protein